jgi:hypothetical protein
MRTPRLRRPVRLLAITVISLLAVTPSARAQENPEVQPPVDEVGRVDSWAVAPAGSPDPDGAGNRPSFSYDLDPGATVKDAVTFYNFGNVELIFRVYPTDAYNNEDGEFALRAADEDPTDVGTWISLPQENVQIPPGQQVTMPITLKVPADAAPGDHVGAILASNAALGSGPDGAEVQVDRRTGTRVYVRVSGDLHPELAVESVKTTYRPTLNPFSGTADVTYRIQNRGNVRLGGSYALSVSGPFGLFEKEIAPEDLEELLPGEGVTLHARFEGVPASVLAFTKVEVTPIGGDVGDDAASTSRTGMTLAAPITLVVLSLAVWMALRARKAHRGHRNDGDPGAPPPSEAARQREPQPA